MTVAIILAAITLAGLVRILARDRPADVVSEQWLKTRIRDRRE